MVAAMMHSAAQKGATARLVRGASSRASVKVPQHSRASLFVARAEPPRERGALTEEQIKDVADQVPQLAKAQKQRAEQTTEELSNARAPSVAGQPIGPLDAMAFSGPAPETINGRLAMLAVTSAVAAELATGTSVFSQFNIAAPFVLGLVGLISVATLVPISKGADENKSATGPFTPKAEIWNGRLAMLGIASLIAIEYFKGSAFFA